MSHLVDTLHSVPWDNILLEKARSEEALKYMLDRMYCDLTLLPNILHINCGDTNRYYKIYAHNDTEQNIPLFVTYVKYKDTIYMNLPTWTTFNKISIQTGDVYYIITFDLLPKIHHAYVNVAERTITVSGSNFAPDIHAVFSFDPTVTVRPTDIIDGQLVFNVQSMPVHIHLNEAMVSVCNYNSLTSGDIRVHFQPFRDASE